MAELEVVPNKRFYIKGHRCGTRTLWDVMDRERPGWIVLHGRPKDRARDVVLVLNSMDERLRQSPYYQAAAEVLWPS